MKHWLIKHRATIRKWGLVAIVIYAIKALIYTSLIVWAAINFTH